MDLAVVTSQLRGRLGALTVCYPGATGSTPLPTGPLTLHFTLDTTGHVTDASIEGSEATPTLGACVEGAIRGMRFRPPSEGSAVFSFPMAFAQGR